MFRHWFEITGVKFNVILAENSGSNFLGIGWMAAWMAVGQ